MGIRPSASLALAALLAAAPAARAAYTVTFTQDGANVFAVGGGTIDTNGLTLTYFSDISSAAVAPFLANELTGAAPAIEAFFTGAISGPSNFGPGGGANATTATGDLVGIFGPFSTIGVPPGYISGGPLSDTAAYDGQTLASLGLTPGSYVYHFGSGATADTFTVDVRVIPEPSTWAMLLVGFGGLAWAGWRRSRVPAATVVTAL